MGLRNIRGGVVIIIMGLLALVYGLASNNLGLSVKVPITIFSIALILFGVFIEHPVLEFLRSQETSDDLSSNFDQR